MKFLPVEWTINPHFGYIDIASPHFLEGTIIGSFHPSFDYSHNKGKYNKKIARYETKISVDNGLTWSNLKVVDEENADSFLVISLGLKDVRSRTLFIVSKSQILLPELC